MSLTSQLTAIRSLRPDLVETLDYYAVAGVIVAPGGASLPTEQQIAAAELPAMKVEAKRAINTEAKRRIYALSGDADLRERNQRRATAVAYERAKSDTLAEPYATWETALVALNAAIEAIVSASNTMTAEADALTTVEAVETYIAGIPTHEGWP